MVNQIFNWYVLRVMSGKEKQVKDNIYSSVLYNNVKKYINNVIIPIERYYQLKGKKKIIRERIFFPGYIMIEIDLNEEIKDFFRKINYIVGFLGEPNNIFPLNKNEIERIIKKVSLISDKSVSTDQYYIGDKIKIIDGPFNGFNGIIEDVNIEKKRLKIIVKIFGRRTPVELNYLQVER